jgi:hypothetical protein
MIRTELPPLKLPGPGSVHHAPELAIVCTLDATLAATRAALQARHTDLEVACWAPGAGEQVRIAAAIVAAAHAMRQLLVEYDSTTHCKIANEIPF